MTTERTGEYCNDRTGHRARLEFVCLVFISLLPAYDLVVVVVVVCSSVSDCWDFVVVVFVVVVVVVFWTV